MSEIERIKAYSEKTKIPPNIKKRYGLFLNEMFALAQYRGPIDTVCMAFDYGMAKGYRAGKKAASK